MTKTEVLQTLKEWQTLASATVALAAICIAWVNVTRQLKHQRRTLSLDLMSREEERMQDALPALREASEFLGGLVKGLRALPVRAETLNALRLNFLRSAEPREAVARAVPSGDDELRRRIESVVTDIRTAADRLEKSTPREGQAWSPGPFVGPPVQKFVNELDLALGQADYLLSQITQKADMYGKRSKEFREAIERQLS